MSENLDFLSIPFDETQNSYLAEDPCDFDHSIYHGMMIPTRLQLGVLRFQRHCVKCVRIRSFSGLYFSGFRLNIERDTEFPSVLSPNAGKY